MGTYTVTLPDVGEGIAEAELSEWNVSIGELVAEDDIIATVMTDKAAVEVPSPVSGRIVWLGGEAGETLAIGSPLVRIEVEGYGGTAKPIPEPDETAGEEDKTDAVPGGEPVGTPVAAAPVEHARTAAADTRSHSPQRPPVPGKKPLASPAVRQRAREAGVDLRLVTGSGAAGRISHEDIDAYVERGPAAPSYTGRPRATGSKDVKVIGMRRKIAEKMALSKARIPHITIVEEVDVTALEELRSTLNGRYGGSRGKLTILPFTMRAIVIAAGEQPGINAHYDDEAGVIHQYDAVHIGIATQTPTGLTVPVVKHAEASSLWDNAREVTRLAEAARSSKAALADLTGSTITITSLGPLGAIATTPIINHPEVAIVGINKISIRPMWDGQAFQPRKMMNISCSFDHRVVDGWDAAVFVQRLKGLLESPALLFIEE